MKRITSQQELDDLLGNLEDDSWLDCFVSFGAARSSKEISFDEDNNYYVLNEIDDSEEIIPHDNLNSTIIGEAIKKGAFYAY